MQADQLMAEVFEEVEGDVDIPFVRTVVFVPDDEGLPPIRRRQCGR